MDLYNFVSNDIYILVSVAFYNLDSNNVYTLLSNDMIYTYG